MIDITNGKMKRILKSEKMVSLDVSPDFKYIATGLFTLKVRHYESGQDQNSELKEDTK